MSDLQERFDGLMALLEKNLKAGELASECFSATEGEIAFTAPHENMPPPTAKTVLELYRINAALDTKGKYSELITALENTPHTTIVLWHIDTDNGGYTIATNPACTEIIGIAKASKTLGDIRREYFMQKETFEKMGQPLLFDYGANENTFINRIRVV